MSHGSFIYVNKVKKLKSKNNSIECQ